MQYGTVQYNTVQYSAVQYSTVQYRAVQSFLLSAGNLRRIPPHSGNEELVKLMEPPP